MLRSVDLRGFGQDGGAALGDEPVDGQAEGRVGGDSGESIGTTALQGHAELTHGDRFTPGLVGPGKNLAMQAVEAGLDRFARATIMLDCLQMKAALGGLAKVLDHEGDLVGFAAKPDHHDRPEVGVADMSPDGALQHAKALVHGAHRTARTVGEGHNAIDVGEVVQDCSLFHLPCDEGGHGGGAVDRGEDAHVVAGTDLSVTPAISLKGCALVFRDQFRLASVPGVGVVATMIRHGEVVFVDVLARRNVTGGLSDDLSDLENALTGGDGLHSHLVSARDPGSWVDGRALHCFAGFQDSARYHDIVVRVELEGLGF